MKVWNDCRIKLADRLNPEDVRVLRISQIFVILRSFKETPTAVRKPTFSLFPVHVTDVESIFADSVRGKAAFRAISDQVTLSKAALNFSEQIQNVIPPSEITAPSGQATSDRAY